METEGIFLLLRSSKLATNKIKYLNGMDRDTTPVQKIAVVDAQSDEKQHK